MGVIRVLSESVINQIAAGEVIENPASLIKELVENSLDAGASKIVVEIWGGGLQRIKVSDNGCGMGEEDAGLCLERHATSKIREAEDLVLVGTMGFRGEALASIGSISRMTVQTALEGEMGTEVSIEGGGAVSKSYCARARGTTIEVRQLFYNVPARRKFQKSESLCASDVTKVMVSLSLAHPMIAFELYHQEKEMLRVVKESDDFLEALKRRVAAVLGEEFLEGATEIDVRGESLSFRGILGGAQNTRPNRSSQYQFVNERAVLCPAVSFAVKEAFGTRIDEGRFPIYVLHVDIPKEYVDVNVHPQKKEIRLREEKWIRDTIKGKIQEQWGVFKEEPLPAFNLFADRSFFKEPEEFFIPKPFAERVERDHPEFSFEMRPRGIGIYDKFLWIEAGSVSLEGFSKEGVLMVDLQAASDRVLFDSLQGKSGGNEQQMLLIPITFPCSLEEMGKVEALEEELKRVGFALEKGRGFFLVEAIPASLEESEVVDFLRSFINEGEERLAAASSKVSSSRGNGHTLFSGMALFSALLKTSSPLICPEGKKIVVGLGKEDFQRFFGGKR